ncbi:MAG: FAD-binding oxidoreductase, partial [Nocardioidaceae bacterium]
VRSFPAWTVQEGGSVNDASCLSRTQVYGVVRPRDEQGVRDALRFARAEGLAVAVGGTRHSMGGQASYPNGLVLDMTGMHRVRVDAGTRTVRVEGGATWSRVLEAVHEEGLSVSSMPSIDVLSVGGTLSVNAHGLDFRVGSLAPSVRSLRLMLADGTVHRVDRTHEPELFHAAIGGYGLFGVILEAELDLVDSEMYQLDQQVVATEDFPARFAELEAEERYRMMYAHLSTSPRGFMEEAILYTYARTGTAGESVPPLREQADSAGARFVLNLARTGPVGERLKWGAQKHLLPRVRSCSQSRNEALREAEACLVGRNQAMYNSLGLLGNRLDDYTDILHEYFLPRDRLVPFIEDAREVIAEHEAVLLNASIRSVHEGDTALRYAKGDRFSLVLYLSQEVDVAGNADMADLTRTLVALALQHGGTFYLPYQQHYTRAEVVRAYPEIDDFFALKRRYDPDALFRNSLWARYATD